MHLMSVHLGKDSDVKAFSLDRTNSVKDEIREMMLEEPLKPWEFLDKDTMARDAANHLAQLKLKFGK
jgi:hypothetical protein